jgi:Holliday junction resolvase RusA-like endonuclease
MLTLPFPPPDLFPNRKNGKHWGATVKIKKAYHDECYYLAMVEPNKPKMFSLVPLVITFHPPDKRKRDIDNCLAAIKPALDAVALAWNINDRDFRPLVLDDGDVVKGGKVVLRW